MLQGYIRFVGGPMHNQHHCCKWELTQEWTQVWVDPKERSWDAPTLRRTRTVYTLHKLVSQRGAVCFEYHVDLDATLDSGNDFYAPLPQLMENILLGEFLRAVVGPYLRERWAG